MEAILHSSCAGLDSHQKVIVSCIIRSVEGKKCPEKFFENFDTTALGLLELPD